MEKTYLASLILRKLGYIATGVEKFLDGVLMYAEEPLGILFDLTAEMKSTVEKLQLEGYIVYAVIRGSYRLSSGELMDATTYLCLQ